MTGIELALQQLALRVAKNGFEKIHSTAKAIENPMSCVKKAVDLADGLDIFEIGDGVKNFVKARAEKERTEKLNRETLEVNEVFFKKTIARLNVADKNKKSSRKKNNKKKGKK